MNSAILRGVGVGALMGLLFGFDTAVIAGTTAGLTTAFVLSPAALGITVSSALWGTLVGAMIAGKPGDRYGAHACLRWVAAIYLVSGLGCLIAWDWPSLLAFRFAAGLAVGASSVLAPVYIAEIVPARRRGALVGLFQLNIVLGILVAYLSNAIVAQFDLGSLEWRVKFGATAVPAIVLFMLSFSIPVSPRWLALRGRVAEARIGMLALGATDPDREIAALTRVEAAESGNLSWRRHRRPILLAIAIAMFNQLSGINAILYYLNDIFAAAGYDSVSADLQAVVIGFTNLTFTGLALLIIDTVGRKSLLLVGSVGLVVTLLGVAGIMMTGQNRELLLWLLIGFIASFALSQGAVIWVYISEIFPSAVRARGQSLGSSTHWMMDAVIATGFPVVASVSSGAPFLVFGVMMAIQFAVVLLFFPETKRTPLDQHLSTDPAGQSATDMMNGSN